jgi:cytochrome bd ubiquinol oxidase subunit II
VILFVLAGLWIAFGDGYAIVGAAITDGPSNPLLKSVTRAPGQWLANYGTYKWTMIAPALGVIGPLLTIWLTEVSRPKLAFVTSASGILGIIATAGVSMFPFLMPSDIMPQASLTVWDSTSSQLTLFVMLLAALLFLPIVLVYTGFAFRTMRGVVTAKQIEGNSSHLY